MAYRAPEIASHHAARLGTVTTNPVADPIYPETALYDNRAGARFRFSVAQADAEIRLSRTDLTPLDFLYIPPGHNLHLGDVGVFLWEESPDGAAWTPLASALIPTSPDEAITMSLGTPTVQPFQRLRFAITTQQLWELSEIIWTSVAPVALGPSQRWNRGKLPTERRTPLAGGGTAVWRLGEPVQRYNLTWSAQEAAGLTQHWDLLEAIGWGSGTPFLLLPPDDIDSWLWVVLEQPLALPEQDHPNPGGFEPTYTFIYQLRENR